MLLAAVGWKNSTVIAIGIPAIGTFVLYGLINVETRYVAPWGVILFLCWLASLEFSRRISSQSIFKQVLIAVTIVEIIEIGVDFGWSINRVTRTPAYAQPDNPNWLVADSLQKLGIQNGQEIAFVGPSFERYWARLARIRITMEIPEEAAPRYWMLSDSQQARVSQVLATHGASYLLARKIPFSARQRGWIPLPSSYYALPLRPADNTDAIDSAFR